MIGRAAIIAGCVLALIIGGLAGLILLLCVYGALALLITAVYRGWYR